MNSLCSALFALPSVASFLFTNWNDGSEQAARLATHLAAAVLACLVSERIPNSKRSFAIASSSGAHPTAFSKNLMSLSSDEVWSVLLERSWWMLPRVLSRTAAHTSGDDTTALPRREMTAVETPRSSSETRHETSSMMAPISDWSSWLARHVMMADSVSTEAMRTCLSSFLRYDLMKDVASPSAPWTSRCRGDSTSRLRAVRALSLVVSFPSRSISTETASLSRGMCPVLPSFDPCRFARFALLGMAAKSLASDSTCVASSMSPICPRACPVHEMAAFLTSWGFSELDRTSITVTNSGRTRGVSPGTKASSTFGRAR
mmetsp:Transcript_1555/g.5120  ORF Transcript_1555/g.5120 Transcript_1555/m.5120 type:complete len:317 (+) Transcript_1555:2333-3283(+)